MAIYTLFETYQHQTHLKFGHAAALVLILGIIISVIVYNTDQMLREFDAVALFDYAIPFILLNDGYNMRKQRFFKETSNICIHGVLTTFMGIAITMVLIYYILKLDFVRTSYGYEHEDTGRW